MSLEFLLLSSYYRRVASTLSTVTVNHFVFSKAQHATDHRDDEQLVGRCTWQEFEGGEAEKPRSSSSVSVCTFPPHMQADLMR